MSNIDKSDIALAREAYTGRVRCAAAVNGTVYTSEERGIKPMLSWLSENPDMLRGGAVCDKIIGRAAAFLILYGGVA